MKRNNPSRQNDRKRGGLGRGLEVLLADTQLPDTAQTASGGGIETAQSVSTPPAPDAASGALRNERLELLKEAEALRILMLEFEMIIRADLH